MRAEAQQLRADMPPVAHTAAEEADAPTSTEPSAQDIANHALRHRLFREQINRAGNSNIPRLSAAQITSMIDPINTPHQQLPRQEMRDAIDRHVSPINVYNSSPPRLSAAQITSMIDPVNTARNPTAPQQLIPAIERAEQADANGLMHDGPGEAHNTGPALESDGYVSRIDLSSRQFALPHRPSLRDAANPRAWVPQPAMPAPASPPPGDMPDADSPFWDDFEPRGLYDTRPAATQRAVGQLETQADSIAALEPGTAGQARVDTIRRNLLALGDVQVPTVQTTQALRETRLNLASDAQEMIDAQIGPIEPEGGRICDVINRLGMFLYNAGLSLPADPAMVEDTPEAQVAHYANQLLALAGFEHRVTA
jgi:hypothetical protein